MATTVHADYQDRKRIVFSARGRSMVNVREPLADGPIGYTSTELLLIALGNCSLGALLNSEVLKDAPVRRAEAFLDAEMAQNPVRVATIRVQIVLEVDDPTILERQAEIEAVACVCPLCNTLGNVDIETSVSLSGPADS